MRRDIGEHIDLIEHSQLGFEWQVTPTALALGSQLYLRLTASNVTSYRWEVYDYPAAWAPISGWELATNGVWYAYAERPAPLELYTWGKWLIRVFANGEAAPREETVVRVDNAIGLEETAFLEPSWLVGFRRSLRVIDDWITSTAGSTVEFVSATCTGSAAATIGSQCIRKSTATCSGSATVTAAATNVEAPAALTDDVMVFGGWFASFAHQTSGQKYAGSTNTWASFGTTRELQYDVASLAIGASRLVTAGTWVTNDWYVYVDNVSSTTGTSTSYGQVGPGGFAGSSPALGAWVTPGSTLMHGLAMAKSGGTYSTAIWWDNWNTGTKTVKVYQGDGFSGTWSLLSGYTHSGTSVTYRGVSAEGTQSSMYFFDESTSASQSLSKFDALTNTGSTTMTLPASTLTGMQFATASPDLATSLLWSLESTQIRQFNTTALTLTSVGGAKPGLGGDKRAVARTNDGIHIVGGAPSYGGVSNENMVFDIGTQAYSSYAAVTARASGVLTA